MAFVIALGGMSLCHLVMMLLSFHDDRALAMLVSNATRCPKNGDVNQYTPFEQVKKGVSLIKEYPIARHVPFSHLFNAHTVMSKKGELFQVIELNGFVASTRENDVIDAFKSVKNRLLYQMASPELAIQFYFIKRKAVFLPKGEYHNDYAVALNARLLGSLQQTPLNQNRLLLVISHKAPKFRKKGAQNPVFYENVLKKLDDASSRIISLFKDNDASLLSAHPREYSPLLSFLSELINLDTRAVKTPLQDLSQALPFGKPAFAKRKGVGQITYPNGNARFFAMLSLKEYPDDTHACLMDTLIEAPEELILTQSFTFKHAQYAIHELDKQQRKMR